MIISVEDSVFKNLILKKLEFPFGNVYLMKDVVISEIHEGVVGTAAQASLALEKALEFYRKNDDVKQRIWIANRTHKYSVQPVAWISLKKEALEYLKGYCVVDDTKFGIMSAVLESKFVPINFKSASSLVEAMSWVDTVMKN